MEEKNQKMNLNDSAKEKMPPTRSLNGKNIAKVVLAILAVTLTISFLFSMLTSNGKEETKEEKTEFFKEGDLAEDLKNQDYSNRRVLEVANESLEKDAIEVDDVPTPQYETAPPALTPEEEYLQEEALAKLKRKFEGRQAGFETKIQANLTPSSEGYGNSAGGSSSAGTDAYMKYLVNGIEGASNPNMQEKKKQYLKNAAISNFVLKEALTPAISKYEVKAGTLIPITLATSIVSDLPGQITAIVREDVYDTLTGTERLIPMGSKLYGTYNSEISWGQERVQTVFNRLLLPNGKSINLGSMVAGDAIGRSGMTGKVDMRLGKVVGSVVMAGIIGTMEGVFSNNGNKDKDKNAALRGGGQEAGRVTVETVDKYTSRILDVQPRIEIHSGKRGTLVVEQDIILEKYNSEIEYLLHE